MVHDEKGSQSHGMILPASPDESAREQYCRALIGYLDRDFRPRLRDAYQAHVRPELVRTLGREPERRDIVEAMRRLPANEWYSGLRTIAQRTSYRATGDIIARQLAELVALAKQAKIGSLTLDPEVAVPHYSSALDIHHMPGGYHTARRDDDVFAGALFDRQITVNRKGIMGALNDDAGVSLAAWVKVRFPDLQPKRILEMGCTVGHTALPFKQAFPEAQVHAIDVAAPCLRYAHGRAASIGVDVRFSQQNAEQTRFEDGSFDLVFTRILMHETSRAAVPRIFAECHRLLRAGGLMFHSEGAQFDELHPYAGALRDWDINWNNEPFMETYYSLPLERLFQEAGFESGATFRDYAPSMHVARSGLDPNMTLNGGRYFIAGAVKSDR